MTPEKELILAKFNTLMYMDNNIASIIDNYIYETEEACIRFGCNMEQITKRYGKAHGKLIQFYDRYLILTDKIQSISNWKNGLLDGESREWWFNGQVSLIVMYKDGLKEGDELEYHENGELWTKTSYKKGIIEGGSHVWWKNGNLRYQYFSKEGKSEGDFKEWDEDGKLTEHCEYKDGIQIKNLLY